MARRLQARSIEKSMAKAFNLGISEDSFEVLGVQITIRNLTAPEWQSALDSAQSSEDDVEVQDMRLQLLSRSVVELDGVSFRGVSSIELDELDVKGNPKVIEKEAYLIEHVFSTWPSEVQSIVNDKFFDLSREVEARAKLGVVFHSPQETPEEKFRALLIEAKDLQSQIPFDLSEKILKDTGFKEVKLQPSAFEEELVAPVQQSTSSAQAPSPPVDQPDQDLSSRVPFTKQPSFVVPDLAPVVPQQAPLPQALPANLPPLPEMTPKQKELAALEVVDQNEVLKQPPVVYEDALTNTPRGGINPRFRPAR